MEPALILNGIRGTLKYPKSCLPSYAQHRYISVQRSSSLNTCNLLSSTRPDGSFSYIWRIQHHFSQCNKNPNKPFSGPKNHRSYDSPRTLLCSQGTNQNKQVPDSATSVGACFIPLVMVENLSSKQFPEKTFIGHGIISQTQQTKSELS